MARAGDIAAGDFPDVPPPRAAVPKDVAKRNQREIEQLLRPQRQRRMSIYGLILAVFLAGGAAVMTATVIAPTSGSGIAGVVGPSRAELKKQFQKGKAAGYTQGIKAGKVTEARAAKKRERAQYARGYRLGTKAGKDAGTRSGFSDGYQQAQETYAGAVASAQSQIATLVSDNQRLADLVKKLQQQAAQKPPATGGGATTTGG